MEAYKLYDGTIILEYNDVKHMYSVNGETIYGTTSITGVLDKPALMYWAVNMAIGYLTDNLKPGVSLDEIELKNLLEGARTAHTVKKVKAGDVGQLVHEWLDKYFQAKINKTELPKAPINKEMKTAIKGFFDWAVKNKVIPIASEQKIYSKKFKYAGTFDLLAKINGKLTVIDFKSSKAIYPEMLLQASAYLQAKEEELGKKLDGGVMILRLSKEEEDIKPFEVRQVERESVDELIKVFLACLKIYSWQRKMKGEEIKNNN